MSSSSDSSSSRFDQVLADYLRRCDDGEDVDREAFIAKHPDLADELREYFETEEKFGRVGAGHLDETLASDSGLTVKPTDVVRYFGDYEILEEIARGGMGVVFKARQAKLNRIVAIKMILSGQLATEADVERFYLEAETAANLHHPNIVDIYEIGEHEGQHYFSMPFIVGFSLAELVRDHPVDATVACSASQRSGSKQPISYSDNVGSREKTSAK